MRVLRGGSAEVKPNNWYKFDIELDESDLQAILVKNNIDSTVLTVGQKYKIMSAQAEILVTLEFENQGLNSDQSANQLTVNFLDMLSRLQKVQD